MKNDGTYYRHECPACGTTYHDALPCLYCLHCYSPDVAVSFDSAKRASELSRTDGDKTEAKTEK